MHKKLSQEKLEKQSMFSGNSQDLPQKFSLTLAEQIKFYCTHDEWLKRLCCNLIPIQ